MARDDVEIIRQAYEAWNRRDYEAAEQFLDPEVEFDASARIMNPDVYRGYQGFRRLVDEVADVWDQWRVEPEQFIERDGSVVVVARARARGRSSGVELDEVAYNVWTIREGKAVKVVFHYDRAEVPGDLGSGDIKSLVPPPAGRRT